jgi:hypothetical protein
MRISLNHFVSARKRRFCFQKLISDQTKTSFDTTQYIHQPQTRNVFAVQEAVLLMDCVLSDIAILCSS